MANVELGHKECTIGGVVITLNESREFYLLGGKLVQFASHLETPQLTLIKGKQTLDNNCESLFEVMSNILTDWRSRKPEDCTLQNLYNVLCLCDLKSLAEHLRLAYKQKFNIIPFNALQLKRDNLLQGDTNFPPSQLSFFQNLNAQPVFLVVSEDPQNIVPSLLLSLDPKKITIQHCYTNKDTQVKTDSNSRSKLENTTTFIHSPEQSLPRRLDSEKSQREATRPLISENSVSLQHSRHKTVKGCSLEAADLSSTIDIKEVPHQKEYRFSNRGSKNESSYNKELAILQISVILRVSLLLTCSLFVIWVMTSIVKSSVATKQPYFISSQNSTSTTTKPESYVGRYFYSTEAIQTSTTHQAVKVVTTSKPASNATINITVESYLQYQQQIFGINKHQQISLTIISKSYLDWPVHQFLSNTYLIKTLTIEGNISISSIYAILIQMPNLEELFFKNFNYGGFCHDQIFYLNMCSVRLPILKNLTLYNFFDCEHVMEFVSECIFPEELQSFAYNGEITDQTVLQIHYILTRTNTTVENIYLSGSYDSQIGIFGSSLKSELIFVKTIILDFTNKQRRYEASNIIDVSFCNKLKGLQEFSLINGLIDQAQFKYLLKCTEIQAIKTGLVINDLGDILELEKMPPFISSIQLDLLTTHVDMCSKFSRLKLRNYWYAKLKNPEICLKCVDTDYSEYLCLN